ncbi:metal-binding protein [filamentous cyanobacterium LEGE 11480]|uniref:Metal-binding protein n=1 Tax=Romeriopsis navalis LEGE 11480 TaxID=2777977 RepID=A0A928Z4A4_9CYAN|nr:metal-binding protein [Romeriopsis navalis]MBE9030827.1 metal-binding protein [Romeriopsis navalis LEGE 11480]
MPSGRTHDSITLWCLPVLAFLGWWMTQDGLLVLILCGCFLFSGLMFGPDLDIYSQQYQRWGVIKWVWLPYRRSMSHRSVLSHGVVIGTVLRVAYVTTLVLLSTVSIYFVWSIWQQLLGNISYWQALFQPWLDGHLTGLSRSLQRDLHLWIAGFVGLELGSISHSLSDTVWSSIKRYRRQQMPRGKKKSAKSRKKRRR